MACGALTGDVQRVGWLNAYSHVWKVVLAEQFLIGDGIVWSCGLARLGWT